MPENDSKSKKESVPLLEKTNLLGLNSVWGPLLLKSVAGAAALTLLTWLGANARQATAAEVNNAHPQTAPKRQASPQRQTSPQRQAVTIKQHSLQAPPGKLLCPCTCSPGTSASNKRQQTDQRQESTAFFEGKLLVNLATREDWLKLKGI
ncbi:MAG: hypothetical protein MK135_10575, partial [Polyangiaceae bacterium]|nr:hypothetical protein [Polyangiaceae bacterium]